MGKALIVVVIVVLLVYAFFDLLATPSDRTRYLPKWLRFALVLIPVLGPVLWMLFANAATSPNLLLRPAASTAGPAVALRPRAPTTTPTSSAACSRSGSTGPEPAVGGVDKAAASCFCALRT